MRAKIAWRAAARPTLRHGPARLDHLPEQAGENEFGEINGSVEPDHDVLSTVSVDPPRYFSACGVTPEDDVL
jgi:hypothetical protein